MKMHAISPLIMAILTYGGWFLFSVSAAESMKELPPPEPMKPVELNMDLAEPPLEDTVIFTGIVYPRGFGQFQVSDVHALQGKAPATTFVSTWIFDRGETGKFLQKISAQTGEAENSRATIVVALDPDAPAFVETVRAPWRFMGDAHLRHSATTSSSRPE